MLINNVGQLHYITYLQHNYVKIVRVIYSVLQTVSENARLDVNSPGGDDDLELWDQTGFMLRTDMDDPLTNSKYVSDLKN